jgi:hypothetical protein
MEQEHLAIADTPTSDKKLDLSENSDGATVRLDHLGPVVVNLDGTISRITNWHQMNEYEKKNLERMLLKRNKQRLEALQKKQQETETDGK